jgi:trigger factor
MQVTVEATSKLGRKMTVEVPAEHIDTEVEKRLKSMTKGVKLHGFRPGKVPFKLVKQHYGNRVQQEVLSEILQSSYRDAVTQEKLRPAGGPSIEPTVMGAGKGLTYIATFEVFPEVILAETDGLEIIKPVAEVVEADVDKMVENLRQQRKTWKEVDRPAQQGDQVLVDFVGEVDNEPFEGGKGENVAIEIGDGRMLKEFEDQLVGVISDEKKSISLKFPENYRSAELAGKDAVFNVQVKTISEPVLPEVDDELVKAYGVKTGGVDQFRKDVHANMEKELEKKSAAKVKDQVMEGLIKLNKVELPEALVKEEISEARKHMKKNLGIDDDSRFPDELFDQDARKRVALWLITTEIVKTQDLKPDQVKVQQLLEDISADYDEPQQIINYYRSNKEAMSRVESMVIEEQIVDWVLSKARVKQESMTYDQVVNSGVAETQV